VKDEFLDDFAGKVFSTNKSIRFIGITDDHGRVLGTSYRKDVMRTMSDEELEKYTAPWVMQIMMTERFKEVTGGMRYLLGVYHRLFTAGIPVDFNPKHKLFIMLAFDPSSRDPRWIVEEKILPLIGENREYFM
jgi:hypothetical protein